MRYLRFGIYRDFGFLGLVGTVRAGVSVTHFASRVPTVKILQFSANLKQLSQFDEKNLKDP